MKIKFLILLNVFVLLFSCKKAHDNIASNKEEQVNNEIKEKDLSKLKYIEFALDSRTKKIIKKEGWPEYYQLEDVVNKVKKGDLSFFKDNDEAIKTLLKDLKDKTPKALNQPATIARITALKTKLYKLESLSNLSTTSKTELRDTITEFLESFSNLNLQMNKKTEQDNQNIERP